MLTARTIRGRLADERGQSLVLTLLVLTFLAVSLGTVIFFTAGNQRTSNIQRAEQNAKSLAEAGVNNAISVLANPANSNYLPTQAVLPISESAAIAAGDTKTGASAYQPGTTVTWWGVYCNTNCGTPAGSVPGETWTVHGKATVPNPAGAKPIVQTMSAQIQVNNPVHSNYDVGVWNTVYSPFGPTAGTCDTSIGQGINIQIPVYVGGNLCMGQNATITKPSGSPNDEWVYVGGFLTFQNKQGHIGSNGASNLIDQAHVGSYCQVSSGGQVNPCQSEPVGGSNNTNIWVKGAPTNLTPAISDATNVTAPPICWDGSQTACTNQPSGGWYSFASPGPMHPCETSSGTVPAFDTNDGVMNRSLPTTFNLTPAASYTCTTAEGGLTWNATTRVLTVTGTVFFDGNITFTTSGNQPVTYTGTGSGGACTSQGDCQAVIYASGDITINSELLCAKLTSNGNNCDYSNWNPNNKILVLASNGLNGITVGPSQTAFQGALYATNTVATGQSAVTEGPLVSGTKTVILGQQFGGTFPPITILPFSIAQPPGGFWISQPYNYKYGG